MRLGSPVLRDSEALREPPEKLLQQIWEHQRLLRDQLRTLDGQRIEVLHPGFWNNEPGPDFRGAIIRTASGECRTGDIEIDLSPSGWRQHGHHENPFYAKVILHVVWEGGAESGSVLRMALRDLLDAPLPELAAFFGGDRPAPVFVEGQCAHPLRGLTESQRWEMLTRAARSRFYRKAAELEAWARQSGWEHAMWQGLFGALGYKHNVWAMRRVAESIPSLLAPPGGQALSVRHLQARLLGISQLLPDQISRGRKPVDAYVREMWDIWWRERDVFLQNTVPLQLWRLAGVRPANHPHRRLGLAAHWLARGDLPARLQQWLCQDVPRPKAVQSLLEIVQAPEDSFWSYHWTLRSNRFARSQPLLGPQRLTDLAVNVILPWLWVRARAGGSEELCARAEERYFAWPSGEDNALLRLARRRMLGDGAMGLRGAAAQQGLLQIVREFCDRSNALCQKCLFPEWLRFF